MRDKTRIAELVPLLKEPYSHLALGEVNDHVAYVMNFQGPYRLHAHTKDELYLVLEGEVTLSFKDGTTLVLRKGDSTVVPAFLTHGVCSENAATVLMVKPKDMFPTDQDLE